MECYNIIKNESELRKFIDWLPDLEPHECFYVSLFARHKYASDPSAVRHDKQQLKRFTSRKEYLFEKIQQLEIPVGRYYQNHLPVPQDALALYIHPNPRNYEAAGKTALKKLVDLVTKPYDGYNPHQEVLSAIQNAKGRTFVVDFDVDYVTTDDNPLLGLHYADIVNAGAGMCVRTRGGVHVLVRPDKVEPKFHKVWFPKLVEFYGNKMDQKGDLLLPVPGCVQGNFVPYMIPL